MSLTPLPDQEAVIKAATEAARTAFSELKTFAGVIPPIEDAGVATQELASHPAGHAVNGQTRSRYASGWSRWAGAYGSAKSDARDDRRGG